MSDRTIKVRMPVLVTSHGNWATSMDWTTPDYRAKASPPLMLDSDVNRLSRLSGIRFCDEDSVPQSRHVVWVEAEIPIPDAPLPVGPVPGIAGEVVKVEEKS